MKCYIAKFALKKENAWLKINGVVNHKEKTTLITRMHITLYIIMQYTVKHITLGNIVELLFISLYFHVMIQILNTSYLSK